jgi:uncharacterized membrane protein
LGIALTLHLLAATVWVGGLSFAFVGLRPATAELDAAHRVKMWSDALGAFAPWTWAAIAILLATGFWMIFRLPEGMKGAGMHVHLMLGLGLLMMAMQGHLQFAPLRRLRRAVAGSHWADAGKALGQVRVFIAMQLVLGLAVVAIASGGRYFFSAASLQ